MLASRSQGRRPRRAARGARAPVALGVALAGLAALGLGCAQLGFLPFVQGPDELRRLAQDDIDAGDLEAGYDHLAEIRRRYPESRAASEVFIPAAQIFRRMWSRQRFAEEKGRWHQTEPAFLFEWLGAESRERFAEEKADLLLRQMPWPFWETFRDYAETDPDLAKWDIRVEEDNGKIERVWAAAEAPAE